MKFVIAIAVCTLLQTSHSTPIPDGFINHDIHYDQELILKDKDSPYQLAIDYSSNTLFFSYSDEVDGQTSISSAYVNLKTNEYNTISGIVGGFANTIDNENKIVYIGAKDGLYQFDYETKTAKRINGISHSIWQMFFKNNLYYTTYPDERVYVFKNEKSEIVPELADTRAMLVALNKDLDFYFTNSSGLFKRTKSNSKTVELGDYIANALTADDHGNLYFSTPNGIYFIDEKDNIKEIVSMPDIYGVAIENNGNIIYASSNALLRLKPTKFSLEV